MVTLRKSAFFAPVVLLAALLRFAFIRDPKRLVFDELYYVRDAWSQLQYGYATTWPDKSPEFNSEIAQTLLRDASYTAHPPFGKWLISLGMVIFGPEDGLGWRSATALAGVLSVVAVIALTLLLTKSIWVANVAGLILALDGVHVTLSRVSLLDVHLTLFVVLGALAITLDWRWLLRNPQRSGIFYRPWLIVAAVTLGLATSIKWSGAYFLVAFFVFAMIAGAKARPERNLLRITVQFFMGLLLSVASYLATWLGWILTAGGLNRDKGLWFVTLYERHLQLLKWHLGLAGDHPYAAHPLGWPLGLRPTGMFFERADGVVRAITAVPNILITWGQAVAILTLIFALVLVFRKGQRGLLTEPVYYAAFLALVGFFAGWLPWVLTFSRAGVFQFYAVIMTPFGSLALALILGFIGGYLRVPKFSFEQEKQQARRASVYIFLAAAFLLTLWMWPMWSGYPQAEWAWASKLWLPGWR